MRCLGVGRWVAALMLVFAAAGAVSAAGEVDEIVWSQSFANPFHYQATSGGYDWGEGVNLSLRHFTVDGVVFDRRHPAPRVVIHRVDNAIVSGASCALFAEKGRSPLGYQPDFPGDTAGTCRPERVLSENIINRGLLDVFANVDEGGEATAGNVERIDVLFPAGIFLPSGAADEAGFLIAEKGGNSRVKIAAITRLNERGEVAGFGPLREILPHDTVGDGALRYGLSNLVLRSDFLVNRHRPPNGPPESLGMEFLESFGAAFVSLRALGVTAEQTIYGFSLFGADVDDSVDLLDPASFPLDTGRGNEPGSGGAFGGDADLYGGIAAYFTSHRLSGVTGTVFRDADGSGDQGEGEDGLEDLPLRLWQDDGDGRFDPARDRLVAERRSDGRGGYAFVGLPPGNYWLSVVRTAAAFPAGYQLAGPPMPRLVSVSPDRETALDLALFPVDGPDAALLARGDRYTAMAGQPLRLEVQRNDRIPPAVAVSMSLAAAPALGSLRRVGDVFVYSPRPGVTGEDGFTYTLRGRQGEVSTASVRLRVVSPGNGDSDRDGLPDAVDSDDDNDAIPDFVEGAGDSDGDGIPDQLDPDADGDGIADLFESGLSRAEIARIDRDADGRMDAASLTAPDIERWQPADSDGDGIADYLDLDSDNDGITDVIEAGFADGDGDGRADAVFSPRIPLDSDGDGLFDFRDLDADADGLFDIVEAGLVDADGDGRLDATETVGESGAVLGDAAVRDLDADGNGVPDFQEVTGHKLRTGISGWGGGVIGWWTIPLLWGVNGLRRRRKKIVTPPGGWRGWALAVALVLVCSGGSPAATFKTADDPRWFVTGSVGYSRVEPRSDCDCYRISDDDDAGFMIALGYDLTRYFSVEGYFADLGRAQVSNVGDQTVGSVGYRDYGVTLLAYVYNQSPQRPSPYYFAAIPRQGLSLYGRLGFGGMDNDSGLPIEQERSFHLAIGAGMEYAWRDGFGLRFEYTAYDADAAMLTVGLVKRFGNQGAGSAVKYGPTVTTVAPSVVESAGTEPAALDLSVPVIRFAAGSADLDAAAKQELARFAQAAGPFFKLRFTLRGYAGGGRDEYDNLRLSLARALAVKRYLVEQGISALRLKTEGMGSGEGSSPARRVEILP